METSSRGIFLSSSELLRSTLLFDWKAYTSKVVQTFHKFQVRSDISEIPLELLFLFSLKIYCG